MLRTVLIPILGCVLCWHCGAATLPRAEVNIALYNDVGVDDEVLREAQDVATGIYRKAGLTLLWSRCGKLRSGERAGDQHSCARADTRSIRIVSKSLSLREESFGVAFLGRDGVGVQADVFYSGIQKTREHSTTGDAVILGHVIAHELGHLLLGMNAHSHSGIMQARWTRRELHQMESGLLVFDERESAAMRSRLLEGPAMAALNARTD